MIKKYRFILVITAIITLLPIVAGLFLWDELPDTLATHFDENGEPNGYSSKTFTVFGLPLLLLGLHLLCFFVTMFSPKVENISGKAFGIVLWVCPLISVICCAASFSEALGWNLPFVEILIVFMGILFIALGNYMPKCKQNYVFGIRLPWTIADEEVWNKTHRFAGFLWTVGGVVVLATAVLKSFVLFISVTLFIAVVPSVYSFVLYRRKH